MEIKAGDIVTLKSGGPEMTVEDVGTYSTEIKAKCTWWDGTKLVTQLIGIQALKPVQ